MSKTKNVLLSALIVMVAMAFTFIPVTAAYAASQTPKLHSATFFAKDPTAGIYIKNFDEEGDTVNSIKSSNPKVIKVKKDINEDYGYAIIAKKKGTAKLTVKCTIDGQKYTLKATYKVKAYPNVIKKMKVNGKKVKVTAKKNSYYTKIKNFNKTYAKVKIKQKKGWKLDYAYVLTSNDSGDGDCVEIPKSKIKKGSKISIPKKYTQAIIQVNYNNKSGKSFFYEVELDR